MLGDGATRRITQDERKEKNPVWSPDGKWIAFQQDGELYVMSSNGGAKRRLTNTENFLFEPTNPAWSPSSREIAYFNFTSLIVASWEEDTHHVLDLTGRNNFKAPVFLPGDPDTLIFLARPAQDMSMSFIMYTVSRQTGRLNAWKTGRSLLEMHLDISPDGSTLVYAKPAG